MGHRWTKQGEFNKTQEKPIRQTNRVINNAGVVGDGKNRKCQRAGGGGVSGQRQKTHGMTKQTQEAHDKINKQGEAHVGNQETQKEDRAGS